MTAAEIKRLYSEIRESLNVANAAVRALYNANVDIHLMVGKPFVPDCQSPTDPVDECPYFTLTASLPVEYL